MTLRETLYQDPGFFLNNNVFYQRGLTQNAGFEKEYIELRNKENRLYTDDVVIHLPKIPLGHALHSEWKIRKHSLKKLLTYFRKKDCPKKILEIGCGNGWLSNGLATLPRSEVLGIDVNETELLQAVRIFNQHHNLSFAYADVMQKEFSIEFDIILLASSMQYFSDLKLLISSLFKLLNENGEIHIIDSPVYGVDEVAAAQKRSNEYFERQQATPLSAFYHHHSWNSFEGLNVTILHNPSSFYNHITKLFTTNSPFPWIKITK
jgi:SAM-dependent methyltransferase